MSTPQMRKAFTLEKKKEIIDEAAKNNNQTALAKQFKIPRATIQNILNNKAATLKAIEEGGSSKRARIKEGMYLEMEQALVLWIKQVRSSNLPINSDIVKEKALEIATLLKIVAFEASKGWMDGFKQRHGILFKSTQGEARAINVGSLQKWQDQVFRAELAKFKPEYIFNVDETGLFWQLLPNKTLAFKGGKKSKERITVLVGAYMTGSEKLPLLVIGQSKSPRCFKNVKIPLDYTANAKSWMTGVIFEEWLKKWDKRLLYVDNCSAHPQNLELDNITLKFFPPNTTAMSQPCDQGIIQNLKVHYRRFLLREIIKAIDEKKDTIINLLGALHNLRRCWA